MPSKSTHVCFRCGLPAHYWRGGVWKHVANQHGKSCGKPPLVVSRARLESIPPQVLEAARRITNR
ncbi:hypothetical protein [Streptomyces mirabilis]|uniref:hypothetical protein n=1 Tax=Streptomyces mirabilis TaxID=68239 RepID=UPI0036DA964D